MDSTLGGSAGRTRPRPLGLQGLLRDGLRKPGYRNGSHHWKPETEPGLPAFLLRRAGARGPGCWYTAVLSPAATASMVSSSRGDMRYLGTCCTARDGAGQGGRSRLRPLEGALRSPLSPREAGRLSLAAADIKQAAGGSPRAQWEVGSGKASRGAGRARMQNKEGLRASEWRVEVPGGTVGICGGVPGPRSPRSPLSSSQFSTTALAGDSCKAGDPRQLPRCTHGPGHQPLAGPDCPAPPGPALHCFRRLRPTWLCSLHVARMRGHQHPPGSSWLWRSGSGSPSLGPSRSAVSWRWPGSSLRVAEAGWWWALRWPRAGKPPPRSRDPRLGRKHPGLTCTPLSPGPGRRTLGNGAQGVSPWSLGSKTPICQPPVSSPCPAQGVQPKAAPAGEPDTISLGRGAGPQEGSGPPEGGQCVTRSRGGPGGSTFRTEPLVHWHLLERGVQTLHVVPRKRDGVPSLTVPAKRAL